MTHALIIARGGSRRLPGKNVRPFCGHPLIAWSIAQALAAEYIDHVSMGTDDDEIERIAWDYGVHSVVRHPVWPESANRTFTYMIRELEIRGSRVDTILTMLPTSPIRRPNDIDRLIGRYWSMGADQMTMMTRLREHVVYRDLQPLPVGRMTMFDKDSNYLYATCGMTAASKEWYLTTSPLIEDMTVLEADEFIQGGGTLSEIFFTESHNWQAFECDTLAEFELCEVLMEHYILRDRGMEVYHEYATATAAAD